MTARCSLTSMTDQRVISSSVRPQPVQSPEVSSIAQLFTQGEAGGVSALTIAGATSSACACIAEHKQDLQRQSASGPIGGETCFTSSHQQRPPINPVPGRHANSVPQTGQDFGLNALPHMG